MPVVTGRMLKPNAVGGALRALTQKDGAVEDLSVMKPAGRGIHPLRLGLVIGAGLGGAFGLWAEADADPSHPGPAAPLLGIIVGGLAGALLDYFLVGRAAPERRQARLQVSARTDAWPPRAGSRVNRGDPRDGRRPPG